MLIYNLRFDNLIHGDIGIHVLAADEGIVEHVAHCQQIDEVTRHITHEVGEEILYDRQYTATVSPKLGQDEAEAALAEVKK